MRSLCWSHRERRWDFIARSVAQVYSGCIPIPPSKWVLRPVIYVYIYTHTYIYIYVWNIPTYTSDYMGYIVIYYMYMYYKLLTKWDAHPSTEFIGCMEWPLVKLWFLKHSWDAANPCPGASITPASLSSTCRPGHGLGWGVVRWKADEYYDGPNDYWDILRIMLMLLPVDSDS